MAETEEGNAFDELSKGLFVTWFLNPFVACVGTIWLGACASLLALDSGLTGVATMAGGSSLGCLCGYLYWRWIRHTGKLDASFITMTKVVVITSVVSALVVFFASKGAEHRASSAWLLTVTAWQVTCLVVEAVDGWILDRRLDRMVRK